MRFKRLCFQNNIPLRWVLVVLLVFPTLGAVTLVGYLSYRSGRQAVENLAHQLIKNVGQQVTQELDHYLQNAHQFNQRQIAAIQSGAINLQNLDQLHRYLILQHQHTENLTTLLFATPEGDFRVSHRVSPRDYGVTTHLKPEELPFEASVSKPSNPTTLEIYSIDQAGNLQRYLSTLTNIDVRDHPWYRQAVETGKSGWSPLFQIGSTNLLALNTYHPFYNQSGQLLGVFAVNISLNQLSEFLGNLEIGESGEVYIIERNGLLIAKSMEKMPYPISAELQMKGIGRPGMLEFRRRFPSEIPNPIIQDSYQYLLGKFGHLATVKSPQAFHFEMGNHRYFLNISPYQDQYGLDWLIVTVIPESDFMAEIYRNTHTTILLCLLTLGLAITSGLLIADRLTFRITRFNHISQELANGNLTQRLPADLPIAEIKGLAQAFNRMADQLQQSFDRLENALEESEEKFTTIFRTIPDPIVITNLTEGRLLEVNNRMIEFYGYSREEMIGRTTLELGLWKNLEERQQLRNLLETEGCIHNQEVTTRTRWGENKVVLLSAAVCNLQGIDAIIAIIRDISEQHAALREREQIEEKLRKTEQWLQQYSRQSPTSIYTLVQDPDGHLWFEYHSDAVETIHEVTQAQALENAHLVLNQMHPDDVAGYIAAATRSTEYLELFSYEWRIITPSGKLKWLQAKSKPERRSNGAIAWHGVILDISEQQAALRERKQAEQALRQSEERFQKLAAASPGVIYTVIEYPTGPVKYEYLSPAFEEIYEISVAEVRQDASITFKQIHPDDREGYQQAVKECLQIDKPFKHEWRIITPSGKIKWIQAHSRFQKRDNGEIAWHGVVLDISDRKQLELALQQSEAQIKNIFNSAIAAISSIRVFKDNTWQIDRVSAGVEILSGYTSEELTQDNFLWMSRIDPDDWQRVHLQIYADIFAKRSGSYEYRLRHKDGSLRWISQTNNSCWDEVGECWNITAISVDITDRKQAQQELQQAKEAAEAANHAKSAFLATMSHELRTPLNAILGFTQLMKQDVTLSLDSQNYIKIIYNSGSYLLKLINEILDLSKIEAGKLVLDHQAIDLFDLLQSLHATFSQRVRHQDLQVDLEILPKVPQFMITDAQKLQQVLINLMGNAIKFTQTGRIILRVGLDNQDSFDSDFIGLNFEVKDTGVGISQEDLNEIFEAFTQASAGRKVQEGTGLGLTISQRLVQLMGGEITVRSCLGEGSSFAFTLPVQPTTKDRVKPQNSEKLVTGIAPNQPIYRILVVDDQAENRLLLVKLLEQVGLSVKEAISGEEALFIWQQWHPHLIWMDRRMPGLDGYETTLKIREHEQNNQQLKSTIIIALTAQASVSDRTLALAAGCNDYISKPIEITTLFNKMAEHLGIRYIYRENCDLFFKNETSVLNHLTPENLAVMPDEWIIELYQASVACQHTVVQELIKQIPSEYSSLAMGLEELNQNFEFEKMMQLTQPINTD